MQPRREGERLGCFALHVVCPRSISRCKGQACCWAVLPSLDARTHLRTASTEGGGEQARDFNMQHRYSVVYSCSKRSVLQ